MRGALLLVGGLAARASALGLLAAGAALLVAGR